MNQQTMAASLGICVLALGLSTPSFARGDAFPDSFVAVSGGSGSLEASSSGVSTGKITGTAYGVSVRKTLGKAYVLDAAYDRYDTSKDGADVKMDRIDAGFGFMVGVGDDSSLLLEGVYSRPKVKLSSASACGGSCGDASKHGFGIKTGFIVPIGQSFITSLTMQLLKIQAAGGDPVQGQATFEGSAGYKFTPALGIHAVYRRDAYENRGNQLPDDKTFATSIRGMLSYNF